MSLFNLETPTSHENPPVPPPLPVQQEEERPNPSAKQQKVLPNSWVMV